MVDTCRETVMAGVAKGAAGKKKGNAASGEESSGSEVNGDSGDDDDRMEGPIEEAWGQAQDCCLSVKKCALGAAVDHIFALLDQSGITGRCVIKWLSLHH